jgi:diaminopimelate epimerase
MTAFLKMHGLGNDFAVFDARNGAIALDAATAKAVADRRFGIGCDQVIVIGKSTNGADATMRILNADGGEVEACGNATRCVAQLLMEERDVAAVKIDTPAGLLACSDAGSGLVTVDMGRPEFDWKKIPLAHEVDTNGFELSLTPPRAERAGGVEQSQQAIDRGRTLSSEPRHHAAIEEEARYSRAKVLPRAPRDPSNSLRSWRGG